MDASYDYNTQTVLMSSIDVEDIGNCVLEAVDQNGCYHYLIVSTANGYSKVVEWGPVIPDVDIVPSGYKSAYSYMSYSDSKIGGIIRKWVLGGKGINFEHIEQVSFTDALSNFRAAIQPLTSGED